MVTITSHNPEQTAGAGARLAGTLAPGGVVLALVGGLGAGKTQFVKGIARGLGCENEATSPTFTIVHEYAGGRVPLIHLDLYRIESAEELLALGFDEYAAAPGIVVVEWADKFPALMPPGTQWIAFRNLEGDRREITFLDGPPDPETFAE